MNKEIPLADRLTEFFLVTNHSLKASHALTDKLACAIM